MITTPGEFDRDRWGRPDVKRPDGSMCRYTRATTLAGTIADRHAIEKFGKRQVAVGIALRADLVAAVGAYREDRSRLDELVAEAEQASATRASATIGDAKHKVTGEILEGRYGLEDVSPIMRDEIEPIIQIERTQFAGILGVEVSTVNHDLQAAGTADRIYRLFDGRAVIGDLKTGRWAVEYASQEIAVQLAIYATGEIYSPRGQVTQPWPEDFDPTRGVVIHAPSGEPPRMYEVDLTLGWEGAELAYFTRQYRKAKTFTEIEPIPF